MWVLGHTTVFALQAGGSGSFFASKAVLVEFAWLTSYALAFPGWPAGCLRFCACYKWCWISGQIRWETFHSLQFLHWAGNRKNMSWAMKRFWIITKKRFSDNLGQRKVKRNLGCSREDLAEHVRFKRQWTPRENKGPSSVNSITNIIIIAKLHRKRHNLLPKNPE